MGRIIQSLLIVLLMSDSLVGQIVLTDERMSYAVSEDTSQLIIPPVPKLEQLIKGGIGLPLFRQSTFTPYWVTFSLDATIERKIIGGFAVIGSIESNFSFSRGAQFYSLEAPIAMRYYFSIGRQMKRRSDRHSFFSHYVAIQTHNGLFANLYYDNDPRPSNDLHNYYRGQFLNKITNLGSLNEAFNLMQFAYCQIGTQLRISRSNYLDINAAIPVSFLVYHKFDYGLSTPALITIKYGIAWQH